MSDAPDTWQVEVFFDGECPLCSREIAFVQRRDKRAAIRFTDIADPHFDAGALGSDMTTLMGQIHARLPDGRIIVGVEVFRAVCRALGWTRLVAVMRWPGVRQLLDWGYRHFARHRLRLTGRCPAGACDTRLPQRGAAK